MGDFLTKTKTGILRGTDAKLGVVTIEKLKRHPSELTI